MNCKTQVHRPRTPDSGPQVAYVVSWLNEAQMKPRCSPGLSGASWDSISAAQFAADPGLSEVGGRGLGDDQHWSPLPLLCFPTKRHARTSSRTLSLWTRILSCQLPPDSTHHPPTVISRTGFKNRQLLYRDS